MNVQRAQHAYVVFYLSVWSRGFILFMPFVGSAVLNKPSLSPWSVYAEGLQMQSKGLTASEIGSKYLEYSSLAEKPLLLCCSGDGACEMDVLQHPFSALLHPRPQCLPLGQTSR